MRDALAPFIRPHVLVVDEFGYLAYGDDAANVLYHVEYTQPKAAKVSGKQRPEFPEPTPLSCAGPARLAEGAQLSIAPCAIHSRTMSRLDWSRMVWLVVGMKVPHAIPMADENIISSVLFGLQVMSDRALSIFRIR